ncbi:MAG TPA: ThuA domain-containing protein [Verrucomicrobiae bacterium]|jgi:hypothetical protein|nr:ThuA domain-containing protein [Verrucomicrobiae bacterium]
MHKFLSLLAASFLGGALSVTAADVKPLRALLIAGGCCHDYAAQKDILKKGLEARANVVVDQVYIAIPPGASATMPPLPIYGNPDYAQSYDVIIHDECAADVSNPEIIKGVLAPHRAGVPGVNLHCAMHCYRIGNPAEIAVPGSERAMWFEYLGLQSSAHGAQLPISLNFIAGEHPITLGMTNWTTINEELYNNVQIFPGATPLARGAQVLSNKTNDYVVAWVNEYHGARVFSTTIGHNNATVADPRYLDLVARGLLWACRKLDEKGNIAAGYGARH